MTQSNDLPSRMDRAEDNISSHKQSQQIDHTQQFLKRITLNPQRAIARGYLWQSERSPLQLF